MAVFGHLAADVRREQRLLGRIGAGAEAARLVHADAVEVPVVGVALQQRIIAPCGPQTNQICDNAAQPSFARGRDIGCGRADERDKSGT